MTLLKIILVSLLTNYISCADYVIPTPEFIISDAGFQVSIPDTEGIEIFYFHGRINRKNEKPLESDTIALDTREKIGNKWILKDNNVHLSIGDTINYWIFIQKDGVGYRQPTGYYEVKDFIFTYKATTNNERISTTPSYSTSEDEPKIFTYNDPVNLDTVSYFESMECRVDCNKQLKNMTETINGMQSQIEAMEKVVKQLVKAMNEQFGNMTNFEEWGVL